MRQNPTNVTVAFQSRLPSSPITQVVKGHIEQFFMESDSKNLDQTANNMQSYLKASKSHRVSWC